MINNIFITVVIPCYNSSETIEDCIKSVLNQSVEVDELIVIDDGSTDRSLLIIQQLFSSSTDKIKKILIKQENLGPSAARNNGVNVSSSNYIAFLDSDDQWFPDKIKIQKEFLTQNPDYDIIAVKYESAYTRFSGDINLKQLLIKNYFSTPCVIVKKDAFNNVNGFDERMRFCEDYFLWLNVISNGKGYLQTYLGAGNIQGKRIFGDKGLSSNLRGMHLGIIICYQNLWENKKISFLTFVVVVFMEYIKYWRRIILSNNVN